MKKAENFLNNLAGGIIGVFIGYCIYSFWDFKTNPQLYATMSAPWYTGIILYGIVALIAVLIILAVKFIIGKKYKDK